MSQDKYIQTPLSKTQALQLHAGDRVKITGTIYTARDAAHKRLVETLKQGLPLPFDIQDNIIYYVGPSPAPPGKIIGAAGPTTSYRMDSYTPSLLELGLRGMIGKGQRSETVVDSMKKNTAVYFTAIGGAGALISTSILSATVVAYDDLGPEAIHRLTVENFPAIVTIDAYGVNLYEEEVKKYQR